MEQIKLTLLFTSFCFLFACQSSENTTEADQQFNTSNYKLNVFEDKVLQLVNEQFPKLHEKYASFFIVNTSVHGCSSCTLGQLRALLDHLKKEDKRSFFIISDSKDLNEILKESGMEYEKLPNATFKKHHVEHGNIYEYTFLAGPKINLSSKLVDNNYY